MRRTLDSYPTPGRLTQALLASVLIEGVVLEPCAGAGRIVEVLQASPAVRGVLANDIDLDFGRGGYDATDPNAGIWRHPVDWVVTNPPFNQAMPILANAWDAAQEGVALLLRLSFLEPTNGRGAWLDAHAGYLSDLIVFGSPRPSFTGDGRTDSATVAWMVWRRRWTDCTAVQFVTGWDRPGDGGEEAG